MDWKPITDLWSVTCHMGPHSVACHPTQVNAPCLNHSRAGRYSIYLPRRDERLSWPWWLVIYRYGLPVRRQSPIQVVTTWPGVEPTTVWSQVQRPNHYATSTLSPVSTWMGDCLWAGKPFWYLAATSLTQPSALRWMVKWISWQWWV